MFAIRGVYQKSNNAVLSSYGYRNANKTGEWNGKNNDYGKSGIEITSTERDVTQFRTHTTNVVSTIKALIAPIQDILKPSKKENTIGNIRQAGNVTMPIPAKQTVYDPNDITRTTIKETQIHNIPRKKALNTESGRRYSKKTMTHSPKTLYSKNTG